MLSFNIYVCVSKERFHTNMSIAAFVLLEKLKSRKHKKYRIQEEYLMGNCQGEIFFQTDRDRFWRQPCHVYSSYMSDSKLVVNECCTFNSTIKINENHYPLVLNESMTQKCSQVFQCSLGFHKRQCSRYAKSFNSFHDLIPFNVSTCSVQHETDLSMLTSSRLSMEAVSRNHQHCQTELKRILKWKISLK